MEIGTFKKYLPSTKPVLTRWGLFAGSETPGNHDLFDGGMVSADGGKVVFSAVAFDGGMMVKSVEMWPDRPKFASFNQNLHKGIP